jgi:mRNA-degrading endonuclease RelE of RelBE toxin-antitoxin system
MADDPFAGDVLKLEGEASRWRLRVGSYRIFFSVDAICRTVSASAIVRRTSKTCSRQPDLTM